MNKDYEIKFPDGHSIFKNADEINLTEWLSLHAPALSLDLCPPRKKLEEILANKRLDTSREIVYFDDKASRKVSVKSMTITSTFYPSSSEW